MAYKPRPQQDNKFQAYEKRNEGDRDKDQQPPTDLLDHCSLTARFTTGTIAFRWQAYISSGHGRSSPHPVLLSLAASRRYDDRAIQHKFMPSRGRGMS
jgi:hypothetical protein